MTRPPLPIRFAPLALVAVAALLGAGRAASAQDPPPAPPKAGDPPPVQPAPAGPAATIVTPKPALDSFVCLSDGRYLPGAVTKQEDVVALVPADGTRQEFPREKVLLAVASGKTVVRVREEAEDHADQSGIHAAWSTWLRATHLQNLAGGKFGDADAAARDAYLADLLAAADRLAKWKLRYAAAALLADALDAGAWNDDLHARCLEWEPVYFPLSPPDEERAQLFATWSREIVPMGGTFAPKKEATAAPLPTHWVDDVVTLKTRNLLIRSRVMESELVGHCLRQGEATVRGLESLVGIPTYGNDEPMEIRLYRDRKEYLEDTSGRRAMLWSAGYFSPGEAVSRFYVTRNERTGKLDGKDLEELFEVLSHELTHHWLERRFHRGSRQFEHQPGHWIVEGFARFVEDHAPYFQKGNFKFDFARNEAVVHTQMRRQAKALLPIVRIVDMSPFEFHNNLTDFERSTFYDEGASIVFFMMNRRGPDGRKRLLEYMRKQYAGEFWDMPPPDPTGRKIANPDEGKPIKESWKVLGFASSGEMETAFHAFLEKP